MCFPLRPLRALALVAATGCALGRWTHLACVFDGTDAHVYVDGVYATSGPSAMGGAGEGDIRVGANDPDGDYFEGALDELRVFSTQRTPSEIADAAMR